VSQLLDFAFSSSDSHVILGDEPVSSNQDRDISQENKIASSPSRISRSVVKQSSKPMRVFLSLFADNFDTIRPPLGAGIESN